MDGAELLRWNSVRRRTHTQGLRNKKTKNGAAVSEIKIRRKNKNNITLCDGNKRKRQQKQNQSRLNFMARRVSVSSRKL